MDGDTDGAEDRLAETDGLDETDGAEDGLAETDGLDETDGAADLADLLPPPALAPFPALPTCTPFPPLPALPAVPLTNDAEEDRRLACLPRLTPTAMTMATAVTARAAAMTLRSFLLTMVD